MEILKFGKFKGKKFSDTPQWYQKWLVKQDWFNTPQTKPLHQQDLSGWDGYSRKGQAIYDAIFEQEKAEADMHYCDCGNMKPTNKRSCWVCS